MIRRYPILFWDLAQVMKRNKDVYERLIRLQAQQSFTILLSVLDELKNTLVLRVISIEEIACPMNHSLGITDS